MSEKHLTHPFSEIDQQPDDLKLIHGIGPALERRLHAAGIRTFAQLAVTNPGQLAELFRDMTGLSPDRIAKQNWIGQAHELTEANLQTRQHYALFSIELLMDEENNVRRTRVKYAQTNQEITWAGWEASRLARYIEEQAMLRFTPKVESVSEASLLKEPIATNEKETSLAKAHRISGDFRLTGVEMFSDGNTSPQGSLRAGQPFRIHLLLDLSEVVAPQDTRLRYSAAVYLKKLDSGPHLAVSKAAGEIPYSPSKQAQIDVESHPLQPGIYQMDVLVTLFASSQPASQDPTSGARITAMMEGRLLQVY